MTSFVEELSEKERNDLELELEAFVVTHATHHRPMALVSSGGTAADLEVHSVRCLDNFSTGLRGAVSVEEFLKRGYAVIHLWRQGSASPFARVLSQYLGLKQANHGLDVECLGRLFSVAGEDADDELVKTVLEKERDPWLTDSETYGSGARYTTTKQDDADEIALNRALMHSTRIHKALRERSSALSEGRLLSVPFRSVEEYLAKLQLAAEALRDCRSLSIFYLAAAVSDFYIPLSDRAQHKIQSQNDENGLVLRLKPVPKTLGLLKTDWAPDAFVVTFKLETDMAILRQKAERAVERYGCHMVIGNLLQSRHEKVWILSPEDQRRKDPVAVQEWPFTEITRPRSSDKDSLEASIMDFVIQSHFEYISWHFHLDGSGLKAAKRAHELLNERKQRLQWKRIRSIGLEISGAVIAVAISYSINVALQRRLRGGR